MSIVGQRELLYRIYTVSLSPPKKSERYEKNNYGVLVVAAIIINLL